MRALGNHHVMRELKVANNSFENRAALDHLFEANGYLFFRDALDTSVVAAVRAEYLQALREVGVVDSGSDEPIWNGASLQGFAARIEILTRRQPWKLLRADSTLARWLRAALGESYSWLPLITYRVTPPLVGSQSTGDATARFVRVHQDGYYNSTLGFVVVWLPLMHIDEAVGGLAIAEGCHKRVLPHATSGPGRFGVEAGAIPDDAWARATYRPGDLIVLHALSPHTGLTNHSDRFRLSLDFRLTPRSSGRPILGRLLAIDGDAISIRTTEGRTVALRIDDETAFPFRRGSALDNGGQIPRAELADYLTAGQPILATAAHGRARLVRGFDVGPRA